MSITLPVQTRSLARNSREDHFEQHALQLTRMLISSENAHTHLLEQLTKFWMSWSRHGTIDAAASLFPVCFVNEDAEVRTKAQQCMRALLDCLESL